MNILNANRLSKGYGPRTLFRDASFVVNDGEKFGVIGPNGSGKSTLFKIISGQVNPDAGTLAKRRNATIGYLDQNPTFPPDATPRSVVSEVMRPVREAIDAFNALSERMTTASGDALDALLAEQAALQPRIERAGGWAWEHRVEQVLQRLGLEEVMDRDVDMLSGGQRRRMALARLLLSSPDLMLLDEPTNHLDTDTIEWLEGTLNAWPGAVMLITHDRYFLDRVAERILEVDDLTGDLITHPGNYQVYMERKLERLQQRERAEARRENLLRTELEWLRRGPKARGTKARARIDRAHALMEQGPEFRERSIKLDLHTDQRLGGIVLETDDLAQSFGDLTLFEDVTLRVKRKDRLGLVGPNGAGKSTFLRILLGEQTPSGGTLRWGKNTKVGYIDQERSGLDPSQTVLDALHPNDFVEVGQRRVHKRTYLREFLFEPSEQVKLIESLSGGERCRLLLAKLILEGANFIILDEPTNDLDINSLQVLEDALASFNGCVLLVTHDRYVLNKVCTAILALEDGTIVRYEGDYDFYNARVKARERAERERELEAKRAAEQARAKATASAKASAPKKLSYKERKELEGMEERILEAETDKEDLEATLADPATYQKNADRVPELTQRLNQLTQEIEQLYARWEELESRA